MKKPVKKVLNILILADHPILHLTSGTHSIDFSNYGFSTDSSLSMLQARVKGWMIDDFESFVDDIESLCEYNYKLAGCYKHVPNKVSNFYKYVVKDSNDTFDLEFKIKLKISNRTSKGFQSNAEELTSLKKLSWYLKAISINNELVSFNYEDAFEHIDSLLTAWSNDYKFNSTTNKPSTNDLNDTHSIDLRLCSVDDLDVPF